jgi:hypothetical protein
MKTGDFVVFEEEIQIKRCYWETIERVATIAAIYDDILLLDVQCVPPKQIKKHKTEVQLVPTAIEG